MTSKEKAKELVDKFARIDGYQDSIDLSKCDYEKQCALIAINLRLDGDFIFTSIEYGEDSLEYWQEVKKEIEKL